MLLGGVQASLQSALQANVALIWPTGPCDQLEVGFQGVVGRSSAVHCSLRVGICRSPLPGLDSSITECAAQACLDVLLLSVYQVRLRLGSGTSTRKSRPRSEPEPASGAAKDRSGPGPRAQVEAPPVRTRPGHARARRATRGGHGYFFCMFNISHIGNLL